MAYSALVRKAGVYQRMLAIGAVFIVLGLVQWIWLEPREFGQGAFAGGLVIALIALLGIARRKGAG